MDKIYKNFSSQSEKGVTVGGRTRDPEDKKHRGAMQGTTKENATSTRPMKGKGC